MTMLLDTPTPVTFSPAIRAADSSANYWLRQVTVRLRREISWIRHERGVMPETRSGALPPYIDKAQAALDMSRFWEEKTGFMQNDVTARYLTELLHKDPPLVDEDSVQGSFGWVVDTLE
jgi:hypothetical protein